MNITKSEASYKLINNPTEYEVKLQIIEINNDFFKEVFNMPCIMSVSIKMAVSSETTLYDNFDLKNKGKINHKYGKVAMEVIIPVRIISFIGMVSLRYNVLESTNKTIVSIKIVNNSDLRNLIS